MRPIQKGSTNQSCVIRIIDSSDGTPETGVVYNTSGIDLWYRREGEVSVDITEVTLAALSTAHADGGFLHINDGYYRLDLPDAAVAAGAGENGVMVGGTVTDMIVIGTYIPLVDYDPYDVADLGLTNLDATISSRGTSTVTTAQVNTECDSALSDYGANTVVPDAAGVCATQAEVATECNTVTVTSMAANVLTATAINADAITSAKIADNALANEHFADGALTSTEITSAAGITLADDAITASKYDESTAFPLGAVNGSTLTEAGGTGDHLTAINLPNQTMDIVGTLTGNLIGDVTGNVDGTVAGVTPDAAGVAATPAEVATALSDIHLDHLIAVADADDVVDDSIIAKIVASDGDWSGFDAATDSQEAIRDRGDADWSSGGATNPNMLLEAEIATVTDQTHFTLATGSDVDDSYNDQAVVLYDDNNSDFPSIRVATDYVGATKTLTIDSAPDFTLVDADSVRIFVTAPGSSAPTVGQIRTEMDDNSTQLADIVADTDDLQTNQGAWATATGFATETKQDIIDSNVDLILVDTRTTLDGKIDTIDGIVDAILVDTAGLNGDVMRGTDSAALASVCTEGRLAELDAGNLPTDIAGLNDISVADIISGVADGSYDLQEMLRIMFSVLAGKTNGGGTATLNLRDGADSKNRVTATVDANGNRTNVVLDGS